ncbi:hypothetical protein M9Y10_013362 [Tritrichomonas musculus]|uniref:N-acetyltransferase domain-containing protein n=1 Tax=Tritrichomonas musculus TaxID=1915356 RepID=A0ABR2I756_9EUKA
MKNIDIVLLPKEKWEGHVLPISYTTSEYYDFCINKHENGFHISIEKKSLSQPITHTPEENDFPDILYAKYFPDAQAYGVLEGEKLVAAIEVFPEDWSNRLRVTELWVADHLQRKGIGHALMEKAKEQARKDKRRAIILETQTCNVNAIGFYLHEGFTFIGCDICCYSNHDIEDKGVRLELGYFFPDDQTKK